MSESTKPHDPAHSFDLNSMFMQGLRCVGGRRGIVYVTVAITSGYRLFQLLDELGCSDAEVKVQHRSDFMSRVFEPNMQDAESWAEQARNAFPGRVVLDPSRLVMPGWSQADYNGLWDSVIDQFVDIVIATPHWAYSRGARKEIEKAIRTGRRVVDLTGQSIPVDALLQHDQRAREELGSWGWSAERIDAELAPLDIEAKPGEIAPDIDTAWPDTFSWVHRDLNDYGRDRQVYTAEGDDARTRLGLTADGGWGPRKMRHYWSQVLDASVTTNLGRVELGSLVGAAVGMLRSVWRVHGPLTTHAAMREPGWKQRHLPPVTPMAGDQLLYLSQIESDVWSWIQSEHADMRSHHTAPSDDSKTVELAGGDAGAWQGELWSEYWDWAVNKGLHTQEGKYLLGKFVVCAFRVFESAVRLYDEPKRIRRDVSREVSMDS